MEKEILFAANIQKIRGWISTMFRVCIANSSKYEEQLLQGWTKNNETKLCSAPASQVHIGKRVNNHFAKFEYKGIKSV